MTKIREWVKDNWTLTILIVLVGAYLLKSNKTTFRQDFGYNAALMTVMQERADFKTANSTIMPPIGGDEPISNSENRLIVEDTGLSLLVDDVTDSIDVIQRLAEDAGGFLVNRYTASPEGAASGTVVVRVPSEKRDEVMAKYAAIAVRVVSESTQGRDVTAEYEDVDARLDVVLKTKKKLETLLDQAVRVSDILEVQRELSNLQYQIDSLQGQKQYLEQAAKYTKITVQVSTDELALPYTPDGVWRPTVVFKESVRSLISTARKAADGAIWLAVYTPVWLALILAWWLLKRKMK